MDRRKKRTSLNQYLMYIKKLEDDNSFRTGTIPNGEDGTFMNNKWKDLADQLNTCTNGPSLMPDEWKKRLNDWKNSTRCKYRRTLAGEKDIHMTSLEARALNLFGKSPGKSNNNSIKMKEDLEETIEENGENSTDEVLIEDESNYDGLLIEPIPQFTQNVDQKIENVCLDMNEVEESNAAANVPVNGKNRAKKSRLEAEVFESVQYTQLVGQAEAQAIAAQLKRIADVKHKKLQFEIAKFKFRNPGFEFTINNTS